MHFQRRKFNSLNYMYNTFTREIPNTENNFYPISLSNHLNLSPTIYLFPVISLNPEIGIRFLSPYFFPARRGEEILGQKARIPGEPKAPQTQESAPLLVGEGKRIKTFIRAFKGSWSTGPEGAPWLCRKENSWNDRTLTSGRFVWACRDGACRDKSRIFISFLSLSLSPLASIRGLLSRLSSRGPRFPFILPRISKSNIYISSFFFFFFLFGFSFSRCWGGGDNTEEGWDLSKLRLVTAGLYAFAGRPPLESRDKGASNWLRGSFVPRKCYFKRDPRPDLNRFPALFCGDATRILL